MKTYRVGVVLEQGGYLEVVADSEQEAEEKALELVDSLGEAAIDDITHREMFCISDTEEI